MNILINEVQDNCGDLGEVCLTYCIDTAKLSSYEPADDISLPVETYKEYIRKALKYNASQRQKLFLEDDILDLEHLPMYRYREMYPRLNEFWQAITLELPYSVDIIITLVVGR